MGNRNRYDGALGEYAACVIRHKAPQLARRPGYVDADREDHEQVMALDLLLRLPRYDPSKASLKTFTARLVDNCVRTLIEEQEAEMRDYRCEAGSLDDLVEDDDGNLSDGPPVLNNAEYIRSIVADAKRDEHRRNLLRDLKKLIATLPEKQRDICRRLMSDTVADVSRDTGIPPSTIQGAIEMLRKRFERGRLADEGDDPTFSGSGRYVSSRPSGARRPGKPRRQR